MTVADSHVSTILVLGWWVAQQRRLDFVGVLVDELGMTKRDALDILNASLELGHVPHFAVPSSRARPLAEALAACGAEIRIIAGGIAEPVAAGLYVRIRAEVSALDQTASSADRIKYIRGIEPRLAP